MIVVRMIAMVIIMILIAMMMRCHAGITGDVDADATNAASLSTNSAQLQRPIEHTLIKQKPSPVPR